LSKEKVQISPLQFTFLFITLVISTADIFLPSFVAQDAKRDSWISPIVSSVFMIPVLAIFIALSRQHRGKNLVEMCTGITGDFIGRIIGFLYAFYFLFVGIGATMAISIVLDITFLPLTPLWVIVTLSIIVALYGVYSDIEVIARVNDLLLPAGMGILMFLILLNVNEYDFNFFRPVLTRGILQPLRGSIVIFGYLCETVVLLQIVKFVNRPEKIGRALFAGLFITSSGILAGTLIYAVFGPLTEIFLIPSLEFARFSSIGKYIQNLDVLVLAIWITGIYAKIMIFMYSGSYAMAQLFRLRDYKAIILPIGFLSFSVAVSSVGDYIRDLYFMHYILPLYSVAMALVIPGMLLAISSVKKRTGRKRRKNKADG